jgi:hypothetical protein
MIREYYDRGGCADCGLPCLGRDCPQCNFVEKICDKCGEQVNMLYDVDGMELCSDCREEIQEEEFRMSEMERVEKIAELTKKANELYNSEEDDQIRLLNISKCAFERESPELFEFKSVALISNIRTLAALLDVEPYHEKTYGDDFLLVDYMGVTFMGSEKE